MRAAFGLIAAVWSSTARADPSPVEWRAIVSATRTSTDNTSGVGFGGGLSAAARVTDDTFVGFQIGYTSHTDSSAESHALLQLHAIVEVHVDPIAIGLGLGFDRYNTVFSGDYGESDSPEWLVGAHLQISMPIVRQNRHAIELLINGGVSPIVDVPGFSHGTTADVVTSFAAGIAYRYL